MCIQFTAHYRFSIINLTLINCHKMSGSLAIVKILRTAGDKHSLEDKIQTADKKFELACTQMTLLSNEIEAVKIRCRRAKDCGMRTQYELLKLRLCTLEGVHSKYFEYSHRLARVLDAMCSMQKKEEAGEIRGTRGEVRR